MNSHSKKRRFKRSREQSRHYLNRALIALTIASTGAAVYFAMQSNSWNQLIRESANPSVGSTKVEATSPIVDPVERDFQDFLEKSTPQRLILTSTELIDDENAELLERLQRQQKKLRIADSLLRIKNDQRSANFGTLSKLKALRKRELINFDHGLTTEAGIGELHDFAYRSAGSGNEDIDEEAQLGKLFARLFRALVFDDPASASAMDPALREFKLVCQSRVQDADVAREIYSLLERIHIRVPENISRSFISEFGRIFKASPSSEIRELADSADEKIIDTEFEFVDVLGALKLDRGELIEELASQIEQSFGRPNISARGYKKILEQIQILALFGRYDIAMNCAELLQRRISSRESLLPLAREAQELKRTYQLAGEKLDLSVIRKTSNSEPFQYRYPDSAVKAVLFFEASSVPTTIRSVKYIMGIAGRYIPKQDFCFSLIMLDDGSNSREKQEFLTVERLVPALDTGIVDIRDEEGKQFVQKYIHSSLPHLLLLDRDGRIAALNVVPTDFERRFLEILGSR